MSGDAYSRYSLTYGQAGEIGYGQSRQEIDRGPAARWQNQMRMRKSKSDESRIADSLEKIEKHLAALVEALGARDRSA